MTIVFVYGTLMQGYGNHRHLGPSEFLGKEQVKGKLYDLPYGFPAATKGRGIIHGECYNVDDKVLNRLDQLEGHPRFYERTKVRLLGNGQAAEMYIFKQELRDAPQILDGKWGPKQLPVTTRP